MDLIAAQTTPVGREIHRLPIVAGHLALAYGDYDSNTGPIRALMLNPADDTITNEATLTTEETWLYRDVSGVPHVFYVDPQGGPGNPEFGQYATRNNDGTWTVHTDVTPVPVHVMGGIGTAEGEWLFGAADDPDPPNGGATVWRKPPGGVWAISLAPRPDPTNGARFYGGVVLNGDLFTVLDDYAGGYHVYRRVAGAWTQPEDVATSVSDLVPFTINGVEFAVIIPYGKQSGFSMSGPTGVLTAIEDASHRTALLAALPSTVRDAVTAGGFLYVLDYDYTLWRIDSAGVKTELLSSLVPVCSLAVPNDHVYFGTTDSKVYKIALP